MCGVCGVCRVTGGKPVPRETVRRKVAKLEAMGLVERDESGGLAMTRKVGRHYREFDRTTLEDLLELAERIRRTAGGS